MLTVLRALLVASLLAAPAASQLRGRGPNQSTQTPISFPAIKACADRAVPGGRAIGVDYDAPSWTYEFRYMRGREIVDIQVDARTCRVIGARENM